MATDDVLRLAQLVRVRGYRRDSERGDSVNSYVRKKLDSFGSGADSNTKRAAFGQALRGIAAPTKDDVDTASSSVASMPKMNPADRQPLNRIPAISPEEAEDWLDRVPNDTVIFDSEKEGSWVKTPQGWAMGDENGRPTGPASPSKEIAKSIGERHEDWLYSLKEVLGLILRSIVLSNTSETVSLANERVEEAEVPEETPDETEETDDEEAEDANEGTEEVLAALREAEDVLARYLERFNGQKAEKA